MSTFEERRTINRWNALNVGHEGLFSMEEDVLSEYFQSAGRLLELGCGWGRVTTRLTETGHDTVAIDVAPRMVFEASDRVSRADFVIGDAASLPLQTGTFDYVIFAYNGIDCVHPRKRRYEVYRECYDCLKPGGLFYFSTHNRYWIPLNWRQPLNIASFLRYYVLNGNIFRNYRRFAITDGEEQYEYVEFYSDPENEKEVLEEVGFDVVETRVENDSIPWVYFQPYIHFICEK